MNILKSIWNFARNIPYKIYKTYHRIKSKGEGTLYCKFGKICVDENGQAIFGPGESGITYHSELDSVVKELERFDKFLENAPRLPPRNHPWWYQKFMQT